MTKTGSEIIKLFKNDYKKTSVLNDTEMGNLRTIEYFKRLDRNRKFYFLVDEIDSNCILISNI